MNPVAPSVGKELVIMTQRLVEAGCKAIGFAEGEAIMLKIQAKRNTELSNTGILEGHFSTVDEVLRWLESELSI